MHIRRVAFADFRNVSGAELAPAPDFNIFWGNNAQGKTNLLEGLYLLGNLKSFRGSRNEELIAHGAGEARLEAEVFSRQVHRKISLSITRQGKKARVDGKNARAASDFFGYLRPVLFSPEEVGLVKGSPSGRRALLDRAIFQIDPTYLDRAQEYDRYLRQRNQLLRAGRRAEEIEPWTEGLIRSGARLRRERFQYLQILIPRFLEAYRSIADNREQAGLEYAEGGPDEADLKLKLREELERHRERETRLGLTLAGPHRDDPRFLLDGRSLRLFGSQGQQRSFVLAFKTAQIMDIEVRTGEPPILLLDDMTSELDRRRQGFFFRFLLERRGQVFITTTDIQPLINEGIRQARFFRIQDGALQQDSRE